MVYYEEKTDKQLATKYSFSSLLRRGSFSGETTRKRGIKKSGVRGGAPLISPLPTPQPTGRTTESSAEERALLVQF